MFLGFLEKFNPKKSVHFSSLTFKNNRLCYISP